MEAIKFKSTEEEDHRNDLLQMLQQKERMDYLAWRSPTLAEMCLKEQYNNFENIEVHGVSIRVLYLILCYVFNDKLKTDSPKELVEVAKAAHKFEIGGLVRLCKHHLSHCYLDKHNVWVLIEASKNLKLETLGKKCLRFLKSLSTKALFEMPEFLETSQDTLLYILKHRDIAIESDVFWMEIIIRWLQHHKNRNRSLLSAIRTFSLNFNEFLDLIEKYPTFFTSKEASRVLYNMLRPGMLDVPPWCETELKRDNTQLYPDYNDIATNALKVPLKTNKKFPKSFFCEEDAFEGSIVFEIKLAKHFPRIPNLVMLELAFGYSYVPRDHLELELYKYDQGGLLVKKKVDFSLKATADHYYLMMNHQMRLQKNIPFVFILKLRAQGLKKWSNGGPISSREYRVAKIPEDIFENICLDIGNHKSVCITLLSDWMVFVNPKRGEKNLAITTFYFDSIV